MSSKNDYWNYLENSVLYHHGVLGMKWGIRRYQPYSTVPRKSGKSGKEVGKAKGTAEEVYNSLSDSEKSKISTSKTYKETPYLYTRTIIKDKKGHSKGYAEIERDPDDPTIGYISVAVSPKYRGQGLSEQLSRDVLSGLEKGPFDKIYWETSKDNIASSKTAKKLGFERAINFDKNDDNYVATKKTLKKIHDASVSEREKLYGRQIETSEGTLVVRTPELNRLHKFAGKHSPKIKDLQDRSTNSNIYFENKKIGDLQTFRESKDELNIVWLGVNKKYNNKGFGQAVFKDTIEQAKKNGYKKVTLEVPGSSPNARHIYEKYGFKDMGQISSDDIWDGLTRMELKFKD